MIFNLHKNNQNGGFRVTSGFCFKIYNMDQRKKIIIKGKDGKSTCLNDLKSLKQKCRY